MLTEVCSKSLGPDSQTGIKNCLIHYIGWSPFDYLAKITLMVPSGSTGKWTISCENTDNELCNSYLTAQSAADLYRKQQTGMP